MVKNMTPGRADIELFVECLFNQYSHILLREEHITRADKLKGYREYENGDEVKRELADMLERFVTKYESNDYVCDVRFHASNKEGLSNYIDVTFNTPFGAKEWLKHMSIRASDHYQRKGREKKKVDEYIDLNGKTVSDIEKELDRIINKRIRRLEREFNLPKAQNESLRKGNAIMKLRINEKETPNIEVKHEGILEVPEGKNVDDLPLSHFVNLANKKGLSKITKALNNLQVWNKNDDPKLSKWAGDMIDKLNKKLKKDESLGIKESNNGISESNNLYDYIDDMGFSHWGHMFGYKIYNEMTDDNTFVLSDNERTAKEYGEWLVDIYKNYDEETIEDRLNEFDYIVSRSKSDVIVTDPEYWKDERKTDKVYIVYEYDNSDVAYIVQVISSWSGRF